MFEKIKKVLNNLEEQNQIDAEQDEEKRQACAKMINELLETYNCALLPVTQIIGGKLHQHTEVIIRPKK